MVTPIRQLVAHNLRLLKLAYVDTNADIAKRGRIATGSVHRLLHGEAATLDVLEGAARAYGLPPWALLVEGFHPARPPRLEGLDSEDARTKAAAWDELARIVARMAARTADGSRHEPGPGEDDDDDDDDEGDTATFARSANRLIA